MITKFAITQTTDKLLFDREIDKKAMVQVNPDVLSFIRHVMQEISIMKRAKTCFSMCKLEFEHSKYLFGKDIMKNISKAKDNVKVQETPYQGLCKNFR